MIDDATEPGERVAYDVVIVGGGSAGLSAALVLGRARRRVAVIDAGRPRNAPAAHMRGFLTRDGMPPNELIAVGRSEVTSYGVKIIDGAVSGIEPGFSVKLDDGRILSSRRILVATGVGDQLPDLPGVRERWGRDVLHCPYCHGWEVQDQPLGVLATDDASASHALLIRQWSDDVVFFAHAQTLADADRNALEARGIRIVYGAVAGLVIDDDQLTGVEMKDGRVVDRSAVFIRTANRAHADGLTDGLGCDIDDDGFVIVDSSGRTSVPGIWAAGNVVDPRAQVITSAGAGSTAAIAINADLVQEDVRRAVEDRTPVSRPA